MVYLLGPIERHARRHLTSELNRRRFDRAKRFVNETVRRGGGDEAAHRVHARWLKFLCGRTSVQRDIWPRDANHLRQFAEAFGLSSAETRQFVSLSLLGRLWRAWAFLDLMNGPPECVGQLTRAAGWEHFDRCRRDGAGVILLPVHGLFSDLFQPYLRYRGHDGLQVGRTNDQFEPKGLRPPVTQRFELARQMHAAKQLLTRGGIVFIVPDALLNLDNFRSVEFFGRQRKLAVGFAELALTTGAHVVPISCRFSPRGCFDLEVGAPFRVPGPESTHDERVDSLVGQYATFLRDEWRRYPWNIAWHHLQHYCLLPKVDPVALGGAANAPRPSEAKSGGAEPGFAR